MKRVSGGMELDSVSHAAWIARSLGRGDFAPLREQDVAELVAELGEERYAGGTLVFREREAPAKVHVVREGLLELSRVMHGRRVTLQLLRPGDVFGDVPLLLRMPEPFDARAIEDSVVLTIDSTVLFRLLTQRPGLAMRWLMSLAARMAGVQQRLVDLLAGDLGAQVASVLLREAESGRVSLTQTVLAEMLGARRSSVNRTLRALETAGLIELGYRQIVLRDPAGLTAIVEGDRLPPS